MKYGMIESCYVNLLQAVDDEYAEMNAISGPTCTNVTFEKEEIILEFGKEESGWRITPNAYPNVSLYCATTVLTRHYAPFVYKPPLTICMNLLRRYIYLQFTPPSASATPTNERKVRTHRTTYMYIWNLTTNWPAKHRPSDWLRGSRLVASWWWCENCIVFSGHSHSSPSLIIS